MEEIFCPFEETPEQQEFHRNLEMWYGRADKKPYALSLIDGVRIQEECICLELIDDDGDAAEFAITIDALVKRHGDFIKHNDPLVAEESKAKTLKALRDAIANIELQHCEP